MFAVSNGSELFNPFNYGTNNGALIVVDVGKMHLLFLLELSAISL